MQEHPMSLKQTEQISLLLNLLGTDAEASRIEQCRFSISESAHPDAKILNECLMKAREAGDKAWSEHQHDKMAASINCLLSNEDFKLAARRLDMATMPLAMMLLTVTRVPVGWLLAVKHFSVNVPPAKFILFVKAAEELEKKHIDLGCSARGWSFEGYPQTIFQEHTRKLNAAFIAPA